MLSLSDFFKICYKTEKLFYSLILKQKFFLLRFKSANKIAKYVTIY